MPRDDERRELVRRRLALAAVQGSRRVVPLSLGFTAVVVVALGSVLPVRWLLVWALGVAVDAARLLVHSHRGEAALRAGAPVRAWERSVIVHGLCFGLTRGSLSLVALGAGNPGALDATVVLAVGVATLAGAATPFGRVYAPVLVGTLVPATVAALVAGGPQRVLGYLGVLFVPVTLVIHRAHARALVAAADATEANAELAAELAAEHARLAEVNERLTEVNAQLAHRAAHDALTGLANRTLALDRLAEVVRTARPGAEVAVLYADLDGFKPVNDGNGHQVGDHVLVAVARRLAGGVAAGDLVARLGGDEFVVVAHDLPGPAPARAMAERLRAAVAEVPISVDGQVVTVGISVGVATTDAPCAARDLLLAADRALYRAKEAGRGRVEAVAHRPGEDGAARHRKPGAGVATA